MARDDFKSLVDELKSIQGGIATLGSVIPAFTYFTSIIPPLLGASAAALAAALAFATMSAIFYRAHHSGREQDPTRLLSRAEWVLLTAFVLLVLYAVILNFTTVTPPGVSGTRFQIGFGKWDQGLTEEGKAVKQKYPSSTVEQWMLDDSLFRQGGPEVLWHAWSIYAAGAFLAMDFILIFCLWTAGWSLLAVRRKHAARPGAPRRSRAGRGV